ncbi:hypothetical protein BGX31_003238 [Mortierella sp. GBA43]|nr:hypothetical protein BGX31_003238 [Mortierella sp. GBA43]
MSKIAGSIYKGEHFRWDMQNMTEIGRHNCHLQINSSYLKTKDWTNSDECRIAGKGTTVAMVHIQDGYGRDANGNLTEAAAKKIREEALKSFESRKWKEPIFLPALTDDEKKKMSKKK